MNCSCMHGHVACMSSTRHFPFGLYILILPLQIHIYHNQKSKMHSVKQKAADAAAVAKEHAQIYKAQAQEKVIHESWSHRSLYKILFIYIYVCIGGESYGDEQGRERDNTWEEESKGSWSQDEDARGQGRARRRQVACGCSPRPLRPRLPTPTPPPPRRIPGRIRLSADGCSRVPARWVSAGRLDSPKMNACIENA